ncbi:MAG: sigma-54 dependent transcriptional regulator [Planctomycetes bacterium]|nr:sigma-54 dependent transcriptional regulator [Planctomycetota bacterium]
MPIRQEPSSRVLRILVVDDDRRSASATAQWLCSTGWHALAAGSVSEAVRIAARGGLGGCLVDAGLPEDGAAVVAVAARASSPTVGLVAVVPPDAQAAAPTVLPKWADATVSLPASDEALLAAIDAAVSVGSRRTVEAEPAVLGSHPSVAGILDIVDRVAGTPATVLITGESGTGKSLLAREIHRRSGRAGRFVEVACGSLSESLLESELFGHVAGSFTGAAGDREGKFLRADRGTIFLDEIATASPAMQVKLLRVLQDMQFEPVGGAQTHSVDARVVLATNENLEALVAAGRFRSDLFWRINVVAIDMPPLRARKTDIPLLAAHFLRTSAARAGRAVEGFTPAAIDALVAHDWPGNVRELQHAIERGVFLGRGPSVEVGDLPAAVFGGGGLAVGPGPETAPLKQALATPERQLIVAALEQAGWRRDVAARTLGINRTTLYKKLKRLGMDLATLEPAR